MPDNLFDDLFLFQDLSRGEAELVYPLFHIRHESAGNVIFEQGDPADFLYIVINGEVAILYKPEDGPELVISRVRAEGVIGWSSAIGNPNYTSTAVCSRECQLLYLSGNSLRMLYQEHPKTGLLILERLAALIAERLKNTHQQVMALLEEGLRIKINRTEIAN
jgi:CRP-like cAMP-binding protein